VAVAAVEGTDMAPTEATTISARKAAAAEVRAPAQRAAVQWGQSRCHQAGPGPVQYRNMIFKSLLSPILEEIRGFM